jgi:hypothetical protein
VPDTALQDAQPRCPACGSNHIAGIKPTRALPEAKQSRRGRKRHKRGLVSGKLPIILATVGGVGLLLCAVVAGMVVLGLHDANDAPPAPVRNEAPDENPQEPRAGAPNHEERPAIPGREMVVFDKDVAGADVPAAVVPPSPISAAPAAGPLAAIPAPQPIVDESPTESMKPLWTIEADSGQAAASFEYSTDLRRRLETARVANHFLLKMLPLMADMHGPFALFFPPDDRKRPINRDGTAPGEGFPPPPVIDLRTGQEVGTFGALAPYWHDSRLSPTAEYLVGPDSGKDSLARPERNTLYVWKRGRTNFERKLTLPGPATWLEFVAGDQLAVLVFDPQPALQVWDVGRAKALHTIRLTAEPFPPPVGGIAQRALHMYYRPWPLGGAVSPGGRHVALANRAGITLVDVRAGKEIGTLPVDGLKDLQETALRGVSFSPDGKELYALILLGAQQGLRLQSWSVTDGRARLDLTLDGYPGLGPPLPGPELGTLLLPGGHVGFGIAAALAYVPPYRASAVMPAALVETRAGSLLAKLDYCVLRWAENGPIVAAGGPPKSDPKASPDQKWDAGVPQEVFAQTPDRPALIAAAKERIANLVPRPAVVRADRGAVKRIAPEPPAAWTAPPAVRMPEPAAMRYFETDFPAAWAEHEAAVLRYDYKLDVRQRFELHWERLDRRNGKNLGTRTMLWPWAHDPGKMKQHESVLSPPLPCAALTSDGKMLAVCDPADRTRVDVWTGDGRRLVGFHPSGRTQEVRWLGWSPGGKLLTVANGSLIAWEAATARAEFEVAGGYTAPVALAGDRTWLALAAGDYVDLLDNSTGACLGRCRAGGVNGAARDIALSPDGRRLAAVFSASDDPKTPKWIAQLWDLNQGQTEVLTLGAGPYQTACWVGPDHLAAFTNEFSLYDLSVRERVAVYHVPIAPPKWQGPVFARAADGRLWYRRGDPRPGGGKQSPGGAWWAIADAELFGSAIGTRLDASPRSVVYSRRNPVRVEVDLGSSERGEKFAPLVAELLHKQGFSIGPKGWALRITNRVVDTSKDLKVQGLIEYPESIPAVLLDWTLLDGDGNTVWERRTVGNFAGVLSKYYTGTTEVPFKGRSDFQWVKNHFDFRGLNMRDAIAAEILDKLAGEPTPLGNVPAAYLKIDRSYQAMPLHFNPIAPWDAVTNANPPPGQGPAR